MYIIFYFVTSSISIVPPFAFYIRLIPIATFPVKKREIGSIDWLNVNFKREKYDEVALSWDRLLYRPLVWLLIELDVL